MAGFFLNICHGHVVLLDQNLLSGIFGFESDRITSNDDAKRMECG